jgi:hypothetical protein
MKSPSVAALVALSVGFVVYEQTVRPALITHLLLFALGVLYGVVLRGAKAKRALADRGPLGEERLGR